MTETIQRREIPAGIWSLDPVHSTARFEVRHSGVATFRGGFGEIEARLYGGEEPRLEGAVKVESIEISEPQLKGHLLSPDFFDAERHPEARFSTGELRVGDEGEVELRGTIEIAGTSRDVEATGRLAHIAADIAGGERIGLSLETAVDRREFGMDWQAELPSGGIALDYEVRVAVELEFVPAEG